MEELRRCLAGSGDSASVAAMSGRLAATPGQEAEELAWQLVGGDSVLAAQAAAGILAGWVKQGRLDAGSTLAQLLACLAQGRPAQGVVPALAAVLCHQLEAAVTAQGSYSCPYSLSSRQHPLVAVLRSVPASWGLVLDQCLDILASPRPVLHQHSVTLLRPLLLFLYTDPNHHDHFGCLRAGLLEGLLERCRDQPNLLELLLDLPAWQPQENGPGLAETSLYLERVFRHCIEFGEVARLAGRVALLPSQALALARRGLSPAQPLRLLARLADVQPALPICWDEVVLVLTEVVRATSPTQQRLCLALVSSLVQQGRLSRLPTATLVAATLHGLADPASCAGGGAELVKQFYGAEWGAAPPPTPPSGARLSLTREGLMARATVKLCTQFEAEEGAGRAWLAELSRAPGPALPQHFPLLSALLVCGGELGSAALAPLVMAVQARPALAAPTLPLLLHMLAKVPSPALALPLLSALPSLAVDRGCVAPVLRLLSSLAARPGLAAVRLAMLVRLWQVEPRCYPALHSALLAPPPPSALLATQLARAAAIRAIMATHSAEHGPDLLPALSSLLNSCTMEEGGPACRLALQGILKLCQARVTDMRSTVAVLAPRLSRDPRPTVLAAYCGLLSLAPTFPLASLQYQTFLSDCLSWLWDTVNSDPIPSLATAAYAAMAAFPIETFRLAWLPATARTGLRLPAKYCSTPEDAARPVEEVLDYVPGECWARLAGVGEATLPLLAGLVDQELTGLPRAVYHCPGPEPDSWAHLPDSSAVRGLQGVLASAATLHPAQHRGRADLQVCLTVLGGQYSRPLPPLDWQSLGPLADSAELRPGLLTLLTRQAEHSRSARQLLQPQLAGKAGLQHNLLPALLPALARGLPAPALSTWLEQAAHTAARDGNLPALLSGLAAALKAEMPDEAMTVVAEAVEAASGLLKDHTELEANWLEAAARLPSPALIRLTSPSTWPRSSPDMLALAARLRIQSYSTAPPDCLTWLSELLEEAGRGKAEQPALLAALLNALGQTPAAAAVSWLLELMGRVSALLRGPDPPTALPLLLDAFCLTVTGLGGVTSLAATCPALSNCPAARLELLPLALCRLAEERPGVAAQLAGWCLHLSSHHQVPDPARATLAASLPVFRYSPSWREASVWGRLVLAGTDCTHT